MQVQLCGVLGAGAWILGVGEGFKRRRCSLAVWGLRCRVLGAGAAVWGLDAGAGF